MSVVHYFCEDLKVQLVSTLNLYFPLSVALTSANIASSEEAFKYLWESHQYLWSVKALVTLIRMVVAYSDTQAKVTVVDKLDELLIYIMRSQTATTLFSALPQAQRLSVLSTLLEDT
jgi:hypothetical protein